VEGTVVVGMKDGKSYHVEVKDEQARIFLGKRIGDTVNVTPLGLKGYEVVITGGSDKCGFPMRKDAHVSGRAKALLSSRTEGYRPEGKGIRKRKTVMGDVITDSISQINTKVVKAGKDSIGKLIGVPEKPAEAEKPAEKPKEAKPVEKKKEEKKEEPKEKAGGDKEAKPTIKAAEKGGTGGKAEEAKEKKVEGKKPREGKKGPAGENKIGSS
jgi:small subunit ribosomal protein S6e